MSSLPRCLRERPFTTAEAFALGVTPKVLRGPQVRRLFTGVYLAAELEVTRARTVAAALRVLPPGTVAAGATALQILGADVGPDRPLRFVSTHPHPVRVPGVQVTRAKTLPPNRKHATTAPYAFLTAAAQLDLVDLVAAGDRLVRLRQCTPADLVRVSQAYQGRHTLLARRAAGLVRERVDSVRESRLRLCLVLAGLPEPACNLLVGDDVAPIGRGDLVYDAFMVILEYEGDHHRTDRRQWNIDIGRAELFTRARWCVIRVTAEQMRRPRVVVARVLDALRRAGYAGPDPVFSREWVRLFETRVH